MYEKRGAPVFRYSSKTAENNTLRKAVRFAVLFYIVYRAAYFNMNEYILLQFLR